MTEELRKLALAATRGPWKVDKPRISVIRENQKAGKEACKMYTIVGPSYVSCYEDYGYAKADAAYIAAASPDVVLGLLDEISRLEQSRRDLMETDNKASAADRELLGKALKELDAARAEVERLKAEGTKVYEQYGKFLADNQELRSENAALRSRLAEIEKPQAQRLSEQEIDAIWVAHIHRDSRVRAIETAVYKKLGINLGE